MLGNDRINLLKIGIITVVLMISNGSYGDTFSYSNQVLHSKNDSSSIEKTRDGVIQVALYNKRGLSCFCHPIT